MAKRMSRAGRYKQVLALFERDRQMSDRWGFVPGMRASLAGEVTGISRQHAARLLNEMYNLGMLNRITQESHTSIVGYQYHYCLPGDERIVMQFPGWMISEPRYTDEVPF